MLDGFAPEVQKLALSARNRVLGLVPDAREKAIRGYNSLSYGFGSKMGEQFASIVLHQHHVNLQFHRWVELEDPTRSLERGLGNRCAT